MNYPRVGLFALTICLLAASSGCAQLRGRRKIREGNAHYKEVRYAEAVAAYDSAAQLLPNFPTLWMNKGITCRQLIIPGAKTPESESAAKCAIESFTKLRELRPTDSRGEQLYIQTLFDADRFELLAAWYSDLLKKNPADLEAVNGLVQVYSKWNRFEDSLQWYRKKAELQPTDAESQYAVGVFVWQQLFQHGGAGDRATFDPRPDPSKPKEKKQSPLFAADDIVGDRRIELSDVAMTYLEKAVSIRPKYTEAMVYANLVQRQKAIAYFEDPTKWEACTREAERWQKQVVEVQAAIAAASGSGPATSAQPPSGSVPASSASVSASGSASAPAAPPHRGGRHGRGK